MKEAIKETLKNYYKAKTGDVKEYFQRRKVASRYASDLDVSYIKPEASKNAYKLGMKRNYQGEKDYVKDQLTKVEKQTRDVPPSNAYIKSKLKRYVDLR
jgi:hypothetical protein